MNSSTVFSFQVDSRKEEKRNTISAYDSNMLNSQINENSKKIDSYIEELREITKMYSIKN
jgi:hypothetical protein